MRKNSVENYYYFGTEMRYLQDAKLGWTIKGESWVLDNIDRFLERLDDLGLEVTKRASHKLMDLKDELEESQTDKLTQEEASRLSKIMNDIRLTLDAEITGLEAFFATPKRYELKKLHDTINDLFGPTVFEKFPDLAKYDFIEAGKCIVYERATAAAFHILRATEANLRHYYKSMVKQNRIKSEMWGPIVQDLQKKTKTKKHITLNNHLDNIRLSFRNPTQHPEATYDIHEAQDLLSICIEANNRMFKVLESEAN